MTKSEASKLISELLKDKRQEEKAVKFLKSIIEDYKKQYEIVLKEKEGNGYVVYEADLNDKLLKNGKVYIMKNFFLCGFVSLWTCDKKLIKILKRVNKRERWFEIKKDYFAGYNISIKGITGYRNGDFEIAVEALSRAVKDKKDFEILVRDKLD